MLYKEEGMFRFWKGIHVMAIGVVPAHTCYFLCYENLKLYFNFNNEEFNYKETLIIGATTTFAHDAFIAPSDGKTLLLTCCSDKAKALALQVFNSHIVYKGYLKIRRSTWLVQKLSNYCHDEHTICKCSCVLK
jgi:hypothetical protein